MEAPRIFFTVSMWNRLEHFWLLVENLLEIHEHDPLIGLQVTDFCTPRAAADLEAAAKGCPFPLRWHQIDHPFCNGMGHNVAARAVPQGTILAVIAVDLKMPPTITRDIRAYTAHERSYYAPQVRYENAEGRLFRCHAAYALFGVYRSDFWRVGGMRQNMRWGGDQREGGEDIWFMKLLKRHGYHEYRPDRDDLVCRFHTRDVDETFYSSYNQYNRSPWWDLRKQGEPI